jgi:hypothetical protein
MTLLSTPCLVLGTRRETNGMTGAAPAFGFARHCLSFQMPAPMLEELAARLGEGGR